MLSSAAEQKLSQLAPSAPVRDRRVSPFPEQPGWHEASFRLVVSPVEAAQVYEQTLAALGTGWHLGGDDDARFAVWNPTPHATFFDARVRFANVES